MMTENKLIENAVKLVVEFFEEKGISEETETIRKRALDWYNRVETLDEKVLAAAAIVGSYQAGTSLNDLLSWKEFYFPSHPIEESINRVVGYCFEDDIYISKFLNKEENFHIGEIEESQRDYFWRE